MKERKISILRCKLNMHSTLNHSTSRTFVSWNMVMVLTFLVDQWNMKRISCDPRGAGHRTVTGEEGRCTLDVSPGGKPSCSWHIRIRNYPARIRNLSPFSLFFKKKMKSQGGNYSNLVQIRILISKQGCWFLLSFCMHVNIFLKPAADISKPKQLIVFTQISRISMMPPLVGHWDLGYLPWIVLNLRSQTCLL
ncbi:uncharacterized protein LOC133700996 isoform X1 [Populus nigra]|uniref:uncharacterized protein LOC133700996 isoform X1 n=1 Tax=Populus nigra TaxID=3691 RepID=UPI002B26745F|nr:uncharacterized protein LOC133700996 isoform X1 [Populus nigra]